MGSVYSHLEGTNRTQVVWKWEHRSNEFRPFCPNISALIEKHYRKGSTSVQIKAINLIDYHIDLKELVQINIVTKKKRKIIREVQKDMSCTIRWSWENDCHEMQFYSMEASDRIEAHFQRGNEYPLKLSLHERNYLIDPIEKYQINLSSGKKRKIERNTVPTHKSLWQWQYDDGEFIDYVRNDSDKIDFHYLSKAKQPLELVTNGAVYLIDTERMLQINSHTKTLTLIRRIEENFVRYGWFWKDKEGRWSPFSTYIVDKLEKNFKSPSQSPLRVTINGLQFEIDTKQMTERSIASGNYYELKREALSNDRAVWIWINKKNQLKVFPAYISHLMESQYMLDDSTPIMFEMRGKTYKLDVMAMKKINIQNKSFRQLERRVVSNNYPSELDLLSESQSKEVLQYLSTTGYLPSDWDWKDQNDITGVFPATDIERNMLVGRFQFEEFEVLTVTRVQNKPLINYFLLERMNIRNFLHGADEPTLLFYLSSGHQKLEEIYGANDYTPIGKYSARNEYGKGLYFTKNSKLANQYAFCQEGGTKVILCCWVLLGRIASINSEEDQNSFYKGKYSHLTDIEKEPPECDSISGMIDDEEVYVLYRPERCYPLYVLEYHQEN